MGEPGSRAEHWFEHLCELISFLQENRFVREGVCTQKSAQVPNNGLEEGEVGCQSHGEFLFRGENGKEGEAPSRTCWVGKVAFSTTVNARLKSSLSPMRSIVSSESKMDTPHPLKLF